MTPAPTDTLARLEQGVLSDPMNVDRWLVYLDFCLEAGLEAGVLVELLSASPELTLQREPGFEVAISVPDPGSRCSVQIRLAEPDGGTGRALSARWYRESPPLDWLVAWPWRG